MLCRLPAALQVGPGFNRDYWARFEKFIKDTAKASDGVYIVTGPLWLPQPDARGNGKWEMKHPMIGVCTLGLGGGVWVWELRLGLRATGFTGSGRGGRQLGDEPVNPRMLSRWCQQRAFCHRTRLWFCVVTDTRRLLA